MKTTLKSSKHTVDHKDQHFILKNDHLNKVLEELEQHGPSEFMWHKVVPAIEKIML